jgi:hypothetical protein
MPEHQQGWWEDYIEDEDDDLQIDEYDLTATPNDFNVLTIQSFIESGAVKIPAFQRNYVWDVKRASKLIESLILGLPVPQIFLYEEKRNSFLVIDGQQRLMSIYYFIKQRFPRTDKRVALRRVFDEKGEIPAEVLHDDSYFTDFRLTFPAVFERKSRFAGLKHETLGEHRQQFDLRPVRNVIVKQTRPPEDDSSVFEIFNRLNTGGINLRPQEIRSSLYRSPFYDMLGHINLLPGWRALLREPEADVHMKDLEILLRGFAVLQEFDTYTSSMTRFLNRFSRKAERYSGELTAFLQALFCSFLESCAGLDADAFISLRSGRFSLALYEAVFTVLCEGPLQRREIVGERLDPERLRQLKSDPSFVAASEKSSASRQQIEKRRERARTILRA